MPASGGRHRLLLYTQILSRWARLVFWIGLCLLAMALFLTYLPQFVPSFTPPAIPATTLGLMAGTGAFALLLAVFLLSIRKSAYVQPFEKDLRLVTPFLRLKIAYRRIRQTASMDLTSLYPRGRKHFRSPALRKLAGTTAIVLDLNGLPLPRAALQLFLSPLFFPDRSERLVLLVPDWIQFSTELESFRSAWIDAQNP